MPAPHARAPPVYADADGDNGMVDNPVYIGGGGGPDNDARSQDPSAFMVTNPAYVSSAAQSLSHKPTTRHRAASVLFEPRGETDTDGDQQKTPQPAAPSHLMVSQRAPHSRLLWLVTGAAFILAAVALGVSVSDSRVDHSKMANMRKSIADLNRLAEGAAAPPPLGGPRSRQAWLGLYSG